MLFEDQEYHRRRAETELESAAAADHIDHAVAHLELARMHRARRELIAKGNLDETRRRGGGRILGTDKEA